MRNGSEKRNELEGISVVQKIHMPQIGHHRLNYPLVASVPSPQNVTNSPASPALWPVCPPSCQTPFHSHRRSRLRPTRRMTCCVNRSCATRSCAPCGHVCPAGVVRRRGVVCGGGTEERGRGSCGHCRTCCAPSTPAACARPLDAADDCDVAAAATRQPPIPHRCPPLAPRPPFERLATDLVACPAPGCTLLCFCPLSVVGWRQLCFACGLYWNAALGIRGILCIRLPSNKSSSEEEEETGLGLRIRFLS